MNGPPPAASGPNALPPGSIPPPWTGWARYLLLTTFRADGTPVATPVWFVVDGIHLLVWTGPDTGKVRRIRRTQRVAVAPCSIRGRPMAPAVPAAAALLGVDLAPQVETLIRRKYPVTKRGLEAFEALTRTVSRRPRGAMEAIQIWFG